MPNVSRPLIGLLVATILFFALWIVALKPGSSSPSGKSGLGQYQSAINAAKASAASQNRAAAAGGNTVASGKGGGTAKPAAAKAAAKPAAAAHPAAAATKHAAATAKPAAAATRHAATPKQRVNLVDRALADHKVLALLFYNPAASDDQAVKQELETVPASAGRVVKLAIPLSELANYPVVTSQVLVQSSPTLVIVDSSRQAFTLVGFSSAFEIAHRVGDALSMR